MTGLPRNPPKRMGLTTKLLLAAVVVNWAFTCYYWLWLSRVKLNASPPSEKGFSSLTANSTRMTELTGMLAVSKPLADANYYGRTKTKPTGSAANADRQHKPDEAVAVLQPRVRVNTLSARDAAEVNRRQQLPESEASNQDDLETDEDEDEGDEDEDDTHEEEEDGRGETSVQTEGPVVSVDLESFFGSTSDGDLHSNSKLKWFVYNMPEKFTPAAHEDVKVEYSPFSAELHFLGQITKRKVTNPEEADVFYVPVLVSAYLMGQNPDAVWTRQANAAVREGAVQMVEEAIAWIQSKYPYWDRRQGRDHVFLFSHENGPCLDVSAERAQQNPLVQRLLRRLRNSLILSHTGDLRSGCFHPARTVLLPPPVTNVDAVRNKLAVSDPSFDRPREVFLWFRDYTTVHSKKNSWQGIRLLYGVSGSAENMGQEPSLEPCIDSRKIKSASHCERARDKCKEAEVARGRVYSRGVRQALAIFLHEFAQVCKTCGDKVMRYSDNVQDISTRIAEMSDATFCLSTRGFADWNVRTYEAMVAGCIPVIVSDDARLPLSDVVDWSRISIRIREARVQNIYEVLSRVTAAEVGEMRRSIKAALLNLTYPHIDKRGLLVRHAEDQLATLLRQRAGGRGAEGAEGAEEAGSNVSSKAYPRAIEAGEGVRGREVCLAVQMSPDRLSMLAAIAQRWHGHIYAVVYVRKDDFSARETRTRFFDGFKKAGKLQDPTLKTRMELEFYRAPSSWKWYPVNLLRNMALRGCAARAQFAMTVDVDFIPNTDAYALMQQHVTKLLSAEATIGRRALVVPAFEAHDRVLRDKDWLDELLGRKSELTKLYLRDKKERKRQTKRTQAAVWPFDQKRSATGHRATNSEQWMKTDTPYRVDYKWGWEPYLLLRAPFPEYDETFVEYGQNKVMYAYELLAAGFEFVVLPDTYLIHAHVDVNKKNSASKPKKFHVGWSCWADFVVRVQDTYDGFRLPTPCWAAKYVYAEVNMLYQDRCMTNAKGVKPRLMK